MKKTLALMLTALMLLATLAAAGAETVLTYANFSASGAQEETLKKMIAVFEGKNPDIRIDLQLTGYNDYFTGLATRVGGGNPPDVFELNM
ncbi:MAG TPA: extracellular solute-binding protein, partial [Clostridia bacterium]|nr:extracellular solute-binding protein [Clostridia bacterium]